KDVGAKSLTATSTSAGLPALKHRGPRGESGQVSLHRKRRKFLDVTVRCFPSIRNKITLKRSFSVSGSGQMIWKKKLSDPSCCPNLKGCTSLVLAIGFVRSSTGWHRFSRRRYSRRTLGYIPKDQSQPSREVRIKNRKRKADEATCPVCNDRVQGSVEELNSHVEMCLRKHGAPPEEDENVDVEGDTEMYEEYEWAGQRRIRATTLLVGGFAATGMPTSSSRPSPIEEEADLVVDGDDSATYGPPQYSEADVVMTSADGPREEKEREALREAIISPDGSKSLSQNKVNDIDVEVKEEPLSGSSSQQPTDAVDNAISEDVTSSANSGDARNDSQTRNQVLEALKNRIRELETETKAIGDEKFKCLICMV
ncbi:hypothetical protein L9F63_021421, partial [Diploptera punctata]